MSDSDESYETIRLEKRAAIGIITLNRPQSLNAINDQLREDVNRAMRYLESDSDVRVIVINGEGRAFSAGFDLKESATRTFEDLDARRRHARLNFEFIMQFWTSPKVTIAAVHGYCLAGAFELAMACDMIVAAQGTRFGEPEVRFGAGIVALLLPWMTSPKLAKELLLTGDDRVDVDRAREMGLVNRVVPAGEHLSEALTLAGAIAQTDEVASRLIKEGLNRSYEAAGMLQALETGLDIDVAIGGSGGAEKLEFQRIRREQGLKAALDWRDARFTKS
jgi:enoyl-CoA hydratase